MENSGYTIYVHLSFVDTKKIKDYIESFMFGAPPHAGGGIGEQ